MKSVFVSACPQCIIWNVVDQSAVSKISVHHDTIYSISWNHNGSAFATTCKDKMIRVIDPRSGLVIAVCMKSSVIYKCYCTVYIICTMQIVERKAEVIIITAEITPPVTTFICDLVTNGVCACDLVSLSK